ncbi:MAG: TlyA family RNA methyltransferase [Chloroflexi bacterium]|nr:TlyA family RNA methyltransferase [Chloroflexota bacterium]MBT3668874.1 TlyA family RNA methyltransferase [Chloroflexota bacterium]MBT4306588.1 TlyA family RNA methyltransferase [Chloroflexota bacterium]MBT4533972.1 TlyA family RNA methyltransferase [Chloroflexota bacterium]MBT4681425.1 TlyA family RNA methyltransferase [Chloroflexota bacterium]
MTKIRVDLLLVEKKLAESRSQAQRLVMAGQVRANGQLVHKPADKLAKDVLLEVEKGPQFVSRGGEKLAGALEKFDIDVNGLVCVDVGSSTGGFTDCLLQNGAQKVYAIDVGKGILHWKMRKDPRVIVMESTNARHVESIPELIQFVVIDASFISLKNLLPAVKSWLGEDGGEVVALIKPQFEAGRKDVAKGKGVIRKPAVHRRVLKEVLSFIVEQNYSVHGLAQSSITGPKGNTEFLAHLRIPSAEGIDMQAAIDSLVPPDEEEGDGEITLS